MIEQTHFGPGDRLPNGAIVIEVHQEDDQRIALCLWAQDVHPFVTWHLNPEGHAYWGNYFRSLEGALRDFRNRTCDNAKVTQADKMTRCFYDGEGM